MPISIDFYLLDSSAPASAGSFLYRLADKVYHNGHWLYIYANSPAESQQVSELLWTFSDISFVPHNIYGQAKSPAPVQIGHLEPTIEYSDILLNLTPEVPGFYNKFQRLLEIVPNTPDQRAAGRSKYKFYQSHNHELRTHKIVI